MPMTPEKEEALILEIAKLIGRNESAQAGLIATARAALSIAAPILRNEAIRDHLETVDELPAKFEEWLVENRDVLGISIVTSLLYDINLLPEQVATFKSMKMLRYCVAVVEHFKMARNEALEEAARVAAGFVGEWHSDLADGCAREAASAIRSLKNKDKPE